jgi:peptide deformylase
MAEQIQNQITIFNVEFREEDDRYTLRINPAITKTQKYHLTELINSVDNALYTVKSSYVMKNSYLELTALLEDNNYTYVKNSLARSIDDFIKMKRKKLFFLV